jgi:hypothetical protein
MITTCSPRLLPFGMVERKTQIPPQTPLPCCPERSVGLSLPVPITARIDLLVELAEQASERTSRKEIVAACILGAPDGADELVRWLRIYCSSPADSVYRNLDGIPWPEPNRRPRVGRRST